VSFAFPQTQTLGENPYKALEDEDRLDPHLSSPFPSTYIKKIQKRKKQISYP
jgi:hypothetical protein